MLLQQWRIDTWKDGPEVLHAAEYCMKVARSDDEVSLSSPSPSAGCDYDTRRAEEAMSRHKLLLGNSFVKYFSRDSNICAKAISQSTTTCLAESRDWETTVVPSR
jgi:hypothetical protein